MQQSRRINGGRDFGPLVEEFKAIEALNKFYVANGWDCRYRQIGKGPLRVEVVSRAMENLVIGTVSVSQRLWGHARSPDGLMSVTLYSNDANVVINGIPLDQDRLSVIPPNVSVDILYRSDGYTLTILVPVDKYEDYCMTVGDNEIAPGMGKVTVIDIGRENLDRFRKLALEVLNDFPNQEVFAALEDSLLNGLAQLLQEHRSGVLTRDPYNRLRKHDNILRVIQYMHQHLAQNVSIETICGDCGTSPSTLERRFRQFLGVTPKQYILAARLNRARRDLLDPAMFDLSIAEVAMRYHLLHMGRFSRNYKELFGRLPSEERDIAMGLV